MIALSPIEYAILSSIETGAPTGLPIPKPGYVGESELKLRLSGLGLASFGVGGLRITTEGEKALAAYRSFRAKAAASTLFHRENSMNAYVSLLEEPGATLEQFAWRCARALSALQHMKELPLTAPVTRPVLDPDLEEEVARWSADLKRYEAMTAAEAETESALFYENEERSIRQWNAERAATLARLTDMEAAVVAWQPAEELTWMLDLRRFMLRQLESEIAMRQHIPAPSPPPRLSPEAWRVRQHSLARVSLGHWTALRETDRARVTRSNAWITQLEACFPKEPT